jgi:chemotaxis protein CheX
MDSFITAATVALAEMAGTDIVVREVYQGTLDCPWGDISAALGITSATGGMLVLSFSERTAAAIAKRVLADTNEEISESLVRDCVGEIANVIAGQAKTLLTGTPHEMTFSLPRVVGPIPPHSCPEPGPGCLVIAFQSHFGEFIMRLTL